MTVNTEEHTLLVSELARETTKRMAEQVKLASAVDIHDPKVVLEMSLSLSTRLADLFDIGFGTRSEISRDGDLSLVVVTERKFVFGMIFHADWVDRPQEDDVWLIAKTSDDGLRLGRYCGGVAYAGYKRCGKPFRDGQHTCDGPVQHQPLPAVAPVTGKWSFHS